MAKDCKEAFGTLLCTEFVEGSLDDPPEKLPSPEDLKYKILIKNKKRTDQVRTPKLTGTSPREPHARFHSYMLPCF